MTLQCLAVVFGIRLLASGMKAVLKVRGTDAGGCEGQHRFTACSRTLLIFKVLIHLHSRIVLRVMLCFIALRFMAPVDKQESRSCAMIFTNGGSANLPYVIHSAAKHRVLNSNEGLLCLLRDPCTGRRHEAPAVNDRSAALCAGSKSTGLSGLVAA